MDMKKMFNSNKMMDRFFKPVKNVVWDIMSGKIGIATSEGITTIEGEGDDAQITINMFDQFGMPVPAFAQNTPVSAVKLGDLIYGSTISGWVVKINEKSFELLKADGTRTRWQAPKVQMMGIEGVNGVMVLRSLGNMLPGGDAGLQGIQGMLMPMMMMGGDVDFEKMMPMILMSQMGTTAVDKDGNPNPAAGGMANMLPMMMMMQAMGSNNSGPTNKGPFGGNGFGNFFDNDTGSRR
jgi:hypothetical protein